MSTPTMSIGFEGYFACRIATDPDPTDEPRGMSGYTMALTNEDPLDQIVRLQIDADYLARNARAPLREMFKNREYLLGVKVRSVSLDGEPWEPGLRTLLNLPLSLNGGDAPLKGAAFDSRNAVTGNDDAMSFVVYPFNLAIGQPTDPTGPAIAVAEAMAPPYTFTDPTQYASRLSKLATDAGQIAEVSEAIGVYDTYGYFLNRRRYLEKAIADAQREPPSPQREATIQGYKSRIQQIDFWGDRISSKLVARCNWAYELPGEKRFNVPGIGGQADTSVPWSTSFWFGGWDGDLLIGYMRGSLSFPFTPDAVA